MKIKDYINNIEALKASGQKVKTVQSKLNASISFLDIDEQIKKAPNGPLHLVPVALKDNYNLIGSLTTAGCKLLDNYISIYDATVVKKLKEAGAIFVSKTNMDELAMGGTNLTSFVGPCNNPYDLKRISGGSSGGSAVLVACGAVPFSLGSDTGDSVRKPASYNGIIGVKPTYGRISRYGIIPYSSSLDHVGYFTNNIYDAAFLLNILAGRDDKDMTSSSLPVEDYTSSLKSGVKGKNILVFGNVIEAIKDEKILELFNKQVNNLLEAGANIKVVHFSQDLMAAIFPVYFIIANAEATANHANLVGLTFGHREEALSSDEIMIKTRTRGFGSYVKKRFAIGSYALHEANQERILRKAQKIRHLICDEVCEALKEADALIAPSACGVAPYKEEADLLNKDLNSEDLIAQNHMVIGNFAGLPSLSIPMGFVDGLPLGLNITCNPFQEKTMFAIGQALEDMGCKVKIKEDF